MVGWKYNQDVVSRRDRFVIVHCNGIEQEL